MNRRHFIAGCAALIAMPVPGLRRLAADQPETIARITLSDREWRQRLEPARYDILRREATERPFSSPLNHEKRAGQYVCAGCGLALFDASMKFDSGTGWPSFFTAIAGHTGTKLDFSLIFPRTEYHCLRCGGHQGHLFDDGPEPTGQRWCNNGLALRFIPA